MGRSGRTSRRSPHATPRTVAPPGAALLALALALVAAAPLPLRLPAPLAPGAGGGGALGAQPPAATGVVEGRITESVSGRPLANVQIGIVGTTLGATTAPTGTFRIAGVPAGTRDVRIRLIGHAPVDRRVTVAAGQTLRLDVPLSQAATSLAEVVVTGTGERVEVRKLGNTIAVVKPPEVAPINSPSELLQGREPGVSMLTSGGMTNEGARIRIRGNASLSQSNEPIIFVDGIRINAGGGLRTGGGGGGGPSRLDDIDPSAIERVEVLKGAAAATLYGTEASNGVIQIFTKKGSAGRPQWQLQVEQNVTDMPLDRIEPNWGFARTQGRADSLSRFYGREIRPFEPFSVAVVDQLIRPGRGTVGSAQVRGGGTNVTYFVSGRYQTDVGNLRAPELGPVENTGRRAQATANLSFVPTSRLRVGVNSSYSSIAAELPNNNNNIYSPQTAAMFAKPEEANCRESVRQNPALASTFGVAGPGRCAGAGNLFGNASFGTIREMLRIGNRQNVERFIGSMESQLEMAQGLRWTVTGGVDVSSQRDRQDRDFGYNVDRVIGQDTAGARSIETLTQRDLTLDSKLSWTAELGRFESQLVAGVQGFFTERNQPGAIGQSYPGPGLEVAGATLTQQVTEQRLTTVNGGFFLQHQLGFDDWIFTTLGGRYDYASAFGEQAPGVFYPKLSVSVVPSDRKGWSPKLGISSLRLRAAIGESGRQPGAFDQFTTFGPLQTGTGIGLVPLNLGNARLAPEISREEEVGFELGLLGERLSIGATGWQRDVRDALVPVQFSPAGGFLLQQLANVGQLRARGAELKVDAIAVNRQHVSLNLFANGAYLWQRITRLGAAPIKINAGGARYRQFLREGYAPGSLFGAVRMRPCAERPAGQTYACLESGQLPFDTNRDGRPDSESELAQFLGTARSTSNLPVLRVDRDGNGDFLDHFLGKPVPDWTGAFGSTLTLRRALRITTLFEYRTGFTMTNLTEAFRNANPGNGQNSRAFTDVELALANPASTPQARVEAARRWADLVALSPQDGLNQNEPGDFLRWRELGLSYTLPRALARRTRASDLQLSVTARNLMLWTRYGGTDPETNALARGASTNESVNNFVDSLDAFGLPVPRRYALVLRATF